MSSSSLQDKPSKISIPFSTCMSKAKEWKKNPANYETINIVELNNCRTTSEASKLISNAKFLTSIELLKNCTVLILKINQEINEQHAEKPKIHEFKIEQKFLISFESIKAVNEKIIYWKNRNEGNYLKINLMKGHSTEMTDFVRNLLIDNDNINYDNSICNDFELANLKDVNNSNLLMKAVESEQSSKLINELLQLPFDINQKSKNNKTAADIAWEMKNNQILLQLLEADSTYPKKFNANKLETDEFSEKIRQFLKISKNMHDAIKNNKSNFIKKLIKQKPNLRYFYNLKNVSAAKAALKTNKFKAYKILLENECSIGPNENLTDIKRGTIKLVISDVHDNASKSLPETHLMILIANSKICHDDHHDKYRLKVIREAFNKLNENLITKQLLQLISMHKNFKIYFDFNRSSIEFMNPHGGDPQMRGLYEDYNGIKTASLYIAAKELLLTDGDEKFAALGTLAHELCHFAMNLTFCNDAKPYAIDGEEDKVKFDAIIEKCKVIPFEILKYKSQIIMFQETSDNDTQIEECNSNHQAEYQSEIFKLEREIEDVKARSDYEEIVSLVFTNYDEELWLAELIVRVPHMITHYQNNPQRLNELKATFKDLFDYYDDIVVKQMNETLPILDKLFNNSNDIELNDLTNAYRAKLHQSKVNFQGVEVKFSEIIEDKNSEILQQLKSEQIRENLIENKCLTIGRVQDNKTIIYIKRDFIDYDIKIKRKWNQKLRKYVLHEEVLNKSIDFDRISSISNDTKMILLSDHAGAGKTITFKHLSVKLKEKFPNYWISYIDLKRHLKVYEKIKRNPDVLEVLKEILSITDELEVEIFTKLFDTHKVILLYNGVDEIAPKFKDFLINFIESVKISTNNQQWIATRPQHIKELENKFNQKVYKLMPYNVNQNIELIENVLKNLGVKNFEAQNVFDDIYDTISYLFDDYIDSPLMIQMITELYVNDKIILENSNLFSLYDRMIDMKKDIVEEKGKIVIKDCDNRKAKLTIWQVHQIYALKLFYDDGFYDRFSKKNLNDINEFQLLKRWEKEKSKWTPDAISRYGFLVIDNWNTDDEFPEFVHRTFAEFFAAQFLIQDLYELDEDVEEMCEKEIELRVKLLIEIQVSNYKYVEIKDFISSFVDIHESKKMHKHFTQLITSNVIRELLIHDDSIDYDLIKILIIDEKFLKEFRFDENKTIFQYSMNEDFLNNILEIVNIYKRSLGADWINHTGYLVKENSSIPNHEEIQELLKQESTKDEDPDEVYSYSMNWFEFLNSIDQLKLPLNDVLNFLCEFNFDSICRKTFYSSVLTQKLVKLIQNNFNTCKNVFLKMMMEVKYINTHTPSDDYSASNIRNFIQESETFLRLDKTISNDDINILTIRMNFYFFGMKRIINLYEEEKITKSEIQHVFIKCSVKIIDIIRSDKFDIAIKDFTIFFKKIFDVKNQLKKFLEIRYEDHKRWHLNNQTVLSYLDTQIKYYSKYSDEIKERLELFKRTLLELAKEIGVS